MRSYHNARGLLLAGVVVVDVGAALDPLVLLLGVAVPFCITGEAGEVSAAASSLVTPSASSSDSTLVTLPLLGIMVPSRITGEAGEVSAAASSLVTPSASSSDSILVTLSYAQCVFISFHVVTLPLLGVMVPFCMTGEAGEVSAAASSLVTPVCAEADRDSVASKPTADSADTDRNNPLLRRLLAFIIEKNL